MDHRGRARDEPRGAGGPTLNGRRHRLPRHATRREGAYEAGGRGGEGPLFRHLGRGDPEVRKGRARERARRQGSGRVVTEEKGSVEIIVLAGKLDDAALAKFVKTVEAALE